MKFIGANTDKRQVFLFKGRDAVFYKNCGCGQHDHDHMPQKIATFNMDTNTISAVLTGEL